MSKLIEIKNLLIDYDITDENLPAISNVNFDIYENEFISLVGPSGCGKSTLLKAIAGFIQPTEGEVTLKGVAIDGPGRERGVVFQDPNLLPWYNVKQNVAIGPKLANNSQAEVDSICKNFLRQVELEEYSNQKVFELSGGQKQRVAIARTLANNPSIILMDEPFGALDSFTRAKMQTMIRKIWHHNKTTILFVTHDIDEALQLGTKLYVMRKGDNSIVLGQDIDYTKQLLEDPALKVGTQEDYCLLKQQVLDLLDESK